MEKGYEKTYNWVIKLLQDCEFAVSSTRLGLKQIADNKTLINFLGRRYVISKDGICLEIYLVAQNTNKK